MTKSKKTSKNASKIWLPNETKNNNTSSPHVFRSLLCIRFVAVAFWSEEEVRGRRGPPVTYFGPALDPPLGGSGRKTTTLVRDLEYFILPSFIKIYQAVLEKKLKYKLSNGRRTDDGRQTDGRRTTEAGQCVITIGHWSLRLLCPKKQSQNNIPYKVRGPTASQSGEITK